MLFILHFHLFFVFSGSIERKQPEKKDHENIIEIPSGSIERQHNEVTPPPEENIIEISFRNNEIHNNYQSKFSLSAFKKVYKIKNYIFHIYQKETCGSLERPLNICQSPDVDLEILIKNFFKEVDGELGIYEPLSLFSKLGRTYVKETCLGCVTKMINFESKLNFLSKNKRQILITLAFIMSIENKYIQPGSKLAFNDLIRKDIILFLQRKHNSDLDYGLVAKRIILYDFDSYTKHIISRCCWIN